MKTEKEIAALVLALADARRSAASIHEMLEEKRQAFARENAELLQAERSLADRARDLELAVRDSAEEVYRLTGIRKTVPGVSIRLVARTHYEPERAIAWAIENKHFRLLKLDTKAFEQAAKALRPACVEVEEVPQAVISSDLERATQQLEADQAAEEEIARWTREHYAAERETREFLRRVDAETGEITEVPA